MGVLWKKNYPPVRGFYLGFVDVYRVYRFAVYRTYRCNGVYRVYRASRVCCFSDLGFSNELQLRCSHTCTCGQLSVHAGLTVTVTVILLWHFHQHQYSVAVLSNLVSIALQLVLLCILYRNFPTLFGPRYPAAGFLVRV